MLNSTEYTKISNIADIRYTCKNSIIQMYGFISKIRENGKINFLIIQHDHEEIQCKVMDKNIIQNLCRWDYVMVSGKITYREKKYINKEQKYGDLEIDLENIKNISKQKNTDIDIANPAQDDFTMNKNRHLYLRNRSIFENLSLRSKVLSDIRAILQESYFIEIHTPIITASTPEGANDFLVMSQQNPKHVYALPQSPQIYKQMLMLSDVSRYYQIAPCFRDETARTNRLPTDFYQLDIEMQPLEDKNEIMNLVDRILFNIITKYGKTKEIKSKTYSYKEIMDKYGYESFDLRIEEEFNYKFNSAHNTATLDNKNEIYKKIKIIDKTIKNNKQITIDLKHEKISEIMSKISNSCTLSYISYIWITDFPKYTKNNAGEVTFTHNPFCKSYIKDGQILAHQYDLIINGEEIGGGSLRANTAKELIETFNYLGYSETEAKEQFTLINIFEECSVPLHGGIAIGIERLMSIITKNPLLKSFLAFTTMQNGKDNLLNMPRKISQEQITKYGFSNISN